MIKGKKMYFLDGNDNVSKIISEVEAIQLFESILFDFKASIKNKNEYNINNFIKFYNKEYFVSGKRIDSQLIFSEDFGVYFSPSNLNKHSLFIVDEDYNYSIVNPEHIFYNFKPKAKKYMYKKSTHRRWKSHTTGNYSRKTGIGIKRIDAKLADAKRELKELGIKIQNPKRWSNNYKDPWDYDEWSRRSSGWKSQKRRHQYKVKDIA